MTDDTNEAAVYSLIEDWRQAVCLGDMPRVLAHHASDIVMFDVPEPLQVTGLAAYRRTWQLFFDQNPPGPERFVLTELHVVVDQQVAFAHALLTICGSTCCRLSFGFRQQEGRWLVAHEHHSIPIRLK